MKAFSRHLRKYVIRGFLAIIPLMLSVLVIHLLYVNVDKRVVRLVDQTIGFSFPGLGIIFSLAALYILGIVASNIIGKKTLGIIEKITDRLPFIKTTYQVGKQLADTLALPDKQAFKRAVLVDYLKPGIWTIGFVTGKIIDRKNNDEVLLKVFVPTPPNPTSGTMVVVKESETRDPGWTIEEAIRAVVSGGIIGPSEIT
jgi:uncharacterized membrane protein